MILSLSQTMIFAFLTPGSTSRTNLSKRNRAHMVWIYDPVTFLKFFCVRQYVQFSLYRWVENLERIWVSINTDICYAVDCHDSGTVTLRDVAHSF